MAGHEHRSNHPPRQVNWPLWFMVGFTTSLKRRLADHFHGEVASPALRRPLALIHCEYCRSEADATRRETYFKTN